jgi:hypothetical protein
MSSCSVVTLKRWHRPLAGASALTHTQGLVTQADRTAIGELPGPIAYGPYAP